MEDKNENVKTYQEGGCTFVVRREFEKGGNSILEQILSLLLDLMEKTPAEQN